MPGIDSGPEGKGPGYASSRRIAGARAREFSLVSSFKSGYRNREDITILPPGILVQGSQNVVTNVSGRIGVVQGYTIDGDASAVISPILGSKDYEMHTGQIRHLRSGFLTDAGNDGKLQYRYVDSSGVVTWRDLLTGLSSVTFRFADFWDTTNIQSLLLMVNGAASITEWTGLVTTVDSVTTNTITKTGTTTWAENGSYVSGNHSVVINGATYAATGGWGTTTLTGVTPDPLAAGVLQGDIAHQLPETTLNSAMTSNSLTRNDLIAVLKNQVYLAARDNRTFLISKQNSYKNYAFTAPVRLVGEGALATLDGNPIGFVPQEDKMYITAGRDQWYDTKLTLSADLTSEKFEIERLETAKQQAAQSQEFISKIANKVVFLSNEPVVQSFGRIEGVVLTPQMTDLSYSIVNDMNAYDFTDGSIFYWKKFIFVAIPKHSLVRIYNQTLVKDEYWEAPVGYPVSRFSILEDGSLIGHSYQTSESYKLFTGYNFNGNEIDARWLFSFENYGTRTASKAFRKLYVEGYISANATLNVFTQYDLDGCAKVLSKDISGVGNYVCLPTGDNTLANTSLGTEPLGGNISYQVLPPKFRVILTFPPVPFFEAQPAFQSVGVDCQVELVSFGPAQAPTSEGQNNITT